MSGKQTIIGEALPNIPWQDKPADCKHDVVWRYDANPVIPRNLTPCSNAIFNSAVVPFEGGFAGVFRVDDRTRHMNLYAGRSKDGINFEIDNDPIEFQCDDPEIGNMLERYDPRVCYVDGKYYVIWCNNYNGYTIGVGYTEDFKTFHQLENAFLPYNRNGVLFPRKINGEYVMLSRPSDTGHTPFGDIFLSRSKDMTYWGKHRFLFGSRRGGLMSWECTKVGPGPTPIETTEGWLMIYHGVLTSCNGFVYSMGGAILDIDEPWKVKYRCRPYLLSPQRDYECVGDTPNVCFPCAVLTDAPSGKMAIYYGAADTVTGLAFAQVDELIAYIKENAE